MSRTASALFTPRSLAGKRSWSPRCSGLAIWELMGATSTAKASRWATSKRACFFIPFRVDFDAVPADSGKTTQQKLVRIKLVECLISEAHADCSTWKDSNTGYFFVGSPSPSTRASLFRDSTSGLTTLVSHSLTLKAILDQLRFRRATIVGPFVGFQTIPNPLQRPSGRLRQAQVPFQAGLLVNPLLTRATDLDVYLYLSSSGSMHFNQGGQGASFAGCYVTRS
jgi:hypothetical protein